MDTQVFARHMLSLFGTRNVTRMSSEEEIDRIRRAQQGDTEAFRALVREHHRRVFNVCLGVLKSTADAEDVTQTVFIRAHKNLPKFQMNAKFSTWLYRIAHNASI